MEKVKIGNNVLIASKVFISDHSHGRYDGIDQDSPDTIPKDRKLFCKPVIIEDNVWIGEFVSILPGVTIGKGSIIGTMSVVNKSIDAYSIAVGCPARVIKRYDFDQKKWIRING
jgi:lipopolysaccharide O-acetyltransferase